MEISELISEIRRASPFIRGITVSGGEATQQPVFLHALFSAIKDDPDLARLTCLVDSNGACDQATWDQLGPVMDGAMLDLKCFDPEIHEAMTGHSNEQVLASIAHLQEMGLLYEVRLLLLAGVNDDPVLLRRTAEWLAALDTTMRLKIIGFRGHGARPQTPALVEPTRDALRAAADLFAAVAPFTIEVV